MAETFDVVIIGSGPGGYVAAIRSGQLGLKTAIVEKDKRLGGTCLLRGCIPTKCLLWTAELWSHVLAASEFGIDLSNPVINWAAAMKHKTKVVTKGADGIDYLMKKNKVQVFKGTGRISGKGKVEVAPATGEKQTLEAKKIIIASGSCFYFLHTHAADGIIHIESPVQRTYTLGEFFDEWGQPLGPGQAGTATGKVTVIVNGKVFTGNPRNAPLGSRENLQLEVGTPLVAQETINWSNTGL